MMISRLFIVRDMRVGILVERDAITADLEVCFSGMSRYSHFMIQST